MERYIKWWRLRLNNSRQSFDVVSGYHLCQLWVNLTPILLIAFSYLSSHSKLKSLKHLICVWLPRFLALSVSDHSTLYRRLFHYIRCSSLNWASRPLRVIGASITSMKLNKILFYNSNWSYIIAKVLILGSRDIFFRKKQCLMRRGNSLFSISAKTHTPVKHELSEAAISKFDTSQLRIVVDGSSCLKCHGLISPSSYKRC